MSAATTILHKMANAYNKRTHDPKPTKHFTEFSMEEDNTLEEEEEEEEEQQQQDRHHHHHHHHHRLHSSKLAISSPSPSNSPYQTNKYSLSSSFTKTSTRSRDALSFPSTATSAHKLYSSSSITSREAPSITPAYASDHHAHLWDDDDEDTHLELPPILLSDHIKALLVQLASTVSSIKTAHAHQQAALNPYNISNGGDARISTADKAIVQELERLSDIHLRLSLLHHIQQDSYNEKDGSAHDESMDQSSNGGEVVDDSYDVKKVELGAKKKDDMLKVYEGIITRFHDEIRRKDAVTEALKETLAKSILNGEKLGQRVRSLESKLASVSKKT